MKPTAQSPFLSVRVRGILEEGQEEGMKKGWRRIEERKKERRM
jgi:hypothetical protein